MFCNIVTNKSVSIVFGESITRCKDIEKLQSPVTVQNDFKTICKDVWMILKCDTQDYLYILSIDFNNVSNKYLVMLMNHPLEENPSFGHGMNYMLIQRFFFLFIEEVCCFCVMNVWVNLLFLKTILI